MLPDPPGVVADVIVEAVVPVRQGPVRCGKDGTAVDVGAYEFRYALSRLRIKSGRAIVQLVNYGEDEHNLRLRRIGGDHTHRLARTAPGEMSELRTRLRAGKFKLWCSLPGHAAAGMKATLQVVKPSNRS